MHAAAAARGLRDRGFDVVAVTEDRSLRGLPDADVLAAATAGDRALVTENVRDLLPLARAGVEHAGLVLTSPRRFARARLAYPGDLVVALSAFLEAPPVSGRSWLWWL